MLDSINEKVCMSVSEDERTEYHGRNEMGKIHDICV